MNEVDSVVTRLFALLGVSAPREGSVIFDFHEGLLRKVRPTQVINIERDKVSPSDKALASGKPLMHTGGVPK